MLYCLLIMMLHVNYPLSVSLLRQSVTKWYVCVVFITKQTNQEVYSSYVHCLSIKLDFWATKLLHLGVFISKYVFKKVLVSTLVNVACLQGLFNIIQSNVQLGNPVIGLLADQVLVLLFFITSNCIFYV